MAISASPAMPRPYSADLRCELLQVYERSALGLEELAEQFGVSYGYSKKIRRQQLHSGQRERVPESRYGPVGRVSAAVQAQLRAELRRKKIALRGRAGQRRSPAAAASLAPSNKPDRSEESGVSGRERGEHRDDPPLWPCAPGGAGTRGHAGLDTGTPSLCWGPSPATACWPP